MKGWIETAFKIGKLGIMMKSSESTQFGKVFLFVGLKPLFLTLERRSRGYGTAEHFQRWLRIVGTSRLKAGMAQMSSDKFYRDALFIQIRSSCSSEQILKFKFAEA